MWLRSSFLEAIIYHYFMFYLFCVQLTSEVPQTAFVIRTAFNQSALCTCQPIELDEISFQIYEEMIYRHFIETTTQNMVVFTTAYSTHFLQKKSFLLYRICQESKR